jgi:tRNA G18 (ribose-2'-O)-methylase SpoU
MAVRIQFLYLSSMTEYIKSRAFFEESEAGKKSKSHPIIVCWKLTTPSNLGSVLRLADNMACEKVLFVDDKPTFKERNIRKTAQTSFKAVEWHFCNTENWQEHIPKNYKLIAIETAEPSFDLYESILPEKTVFFVGNEKVGIDDVLLKECEKSIYIPMKGHNKSMNVSHALTIVLGEWLRQNYYS